MRRGTNENRVERLDWGTNEMGDQWELYNQDYIGGINEMGDQMNTV